MYLITWITTHELKFIIHHWWSGLVECREGWRYNGALVHTGLLLVHTLTDVDDDYVN